MVMEYVMAKTVSDWLKEKGPFSINETVKIIRQLLNAIGHAHKVGVIHRDIKPNNILLCEDGTVKVMDFGLAKLIQEHGEQSTLTQTAGTLYYMSPEQIKGAKIDNRTDIYSIGMTIYEMLTGRTPFEKDAGEYNIQKQIIEGKIESPEKYNPGIPRYFVKFIMKALEKNPDKRFQDVTSMLSELYQFDTSETSSNDKTRIISNHESSSNNFWKKKKIIAGSSALLLILIFSVYIIMLKPFNNKVSQVVINKDSVIYQRGDVIKFAKLSIDSSPLGAKVIIDNKLVGKTPFFKDSLKIKNYSIALKMDGYKDWIESDFRMMTGDNNITANLTPAVVKARSTLILNAIPRATIYVDNSKIASNTNETIRNYVSPGKHKVTFINSELGSKDLVLNVSNKQSKTITCYFRQQINIQSLNINGDAFWGTIYINGINTGKTTPGDTLLGEGKYKITVKKTGYKTVENDAVLNIVPAFELKTHSLVFHLK